VGIPLLAALVGITAPDWSVRVLQAVAWPVVVGLAVVLLIGTVSGSQILQSILGRVNKMSALGVTLELTSAGAKKVQFSVKSAFDDYTNRINSEFDRQIQARQVNDKLALVVQEAIKATFSGQELPKKYRCTIHLEDVLFKDALYQLVDYYPSGGGPRGRRFGVRYGIIGKTWRLRTDQIQDDVFKGGNTAVIVETLVRD